MVKILIISSFLTTTKYKGKMRLIGCIISLQVIILNYWNYIFDLMVVVIHHGHHQSCDNSS